MNKILQEVLKRVQPNEKEVTQITELAQRLLSLLQLLASEDHILLGRGTEG